MYYPGGSQSPHIEYHPSRPAAEPANLNVYQGLISQRVHNRNISRAQNHGGFDLGTEYFVTQVPNGCSCVELDGMSLVNYANADVIVQIFDHLLKGDDHHSEVLPRVASSTLRTDPENKLYSS